MPVTVTVTGQLLSSLASAWPSSSSSEIAQPVLPVPVPIVTSSGAVIVGLVVSLTPQPAAFTVTVCLQVAVRPSASVTVQSIPVMPTGYGSVNGTIIAGVTKTPSSSNTAGVPSLRTPTTVPPPDALNVGVPTTTVASSV